MPVGELSGDKRVIVIGSGPAGAITAHRLVNKGIPVTLLESGVDIPGGKLVRVWDRTIFRQIDGTFEKHAGHISVGDPQTEWIFSLAPGGLSNQWTGAVPRFSPRDFDEGQRLHEKYRWPLSYDDLLPYYEIVESILRVTGDPRDVPQLPANRISHVSQLPKDWQSVAQHAEAYGHGLASQPIADGGPQMVAKRGTAFNSFTEIIAPLTEDTRSNLFNLITGAHALQLIWSGEAKRVTGVIYKDQRTGSERRVCGSAVVVAAGALASTKLLLHSACSDFPNGLGETQGVLGRYLHDHPKEWWIFDVDKPLALLGHAAYLSRAPYETSEPLMAAQCVVGHASSLDKIWSLLPLKSKAFGVQVFGTMVPSDKHSVRLHDHHKDGFGVPKLEIDIHFDKQTVENMVGARSHFLNILERAGYHGAIRPFEPQLFPGNSVHYGGTIRMHTSPKYGMTDSWNRLHAIPNVLVVDNSCFTTGVEKNPTVTEMAIAARAADRLADDLRHA